MIARADKLGEGPDSMAYIAKFHEVFVSKARPEEVGDGMKRPGDMPAPQA